MAAPRGIRLPISCEPCRMRKIRCSRDGTPCATCVRRSVPAGQCRYAKGTSSTTSPSSGSLVAPQPPPQRPLSPELSRQGDLFERVQKLEQLVRDQSATTADTLNHPPPAPPPPAPVIPRRRRRSQSGPSSSPEAVHAATHFSGTLQTNASGYVRFVPSFLDWHTRLGIPESCNDAYSSAIPKPATCPLGSDQRRRSRHELLNAIPPRSQCTELVRIYFTSFASLFHILHDPTFYQQYDLFQQNPESTPLAWLSLLYAILSTAVLALSPDSDVLHDLSLLPTGFRKVAALSDRYRSLAMECLEADNYMWDHNVTTLQALILIIHGISHTHGQAWTLLGLTHHLALSIGCHVDPHAFGLGAIECEERRRAWAGLKMLYASQNASMGNVGLGHAMMPSNCEPPANVDDEDLLPAHGPVSRAANKQAATQMTYLLFKFRLYDLCTEICDRVFRANTVHDNILQYLDDRIQEERRSWGVAYGVAQPEPLPPYHLAHVNILHSYANHLMLLLHHRNAALCTTGPQRISSQWSQRRCLDSAKRVLDIHSLLNESAELVSFRWYGRGLGSFHAFYAAMIMITQSHSETIANRDLLMGCLARFQALSELSPLCARAAPMMERLLEKISWAGAHVETGSSTLTPTPRMENSLRPLSSDLHPQPQTPQSLNPGSAHESTSSRTRDIDWDIIISEFQPQQWLTPAHLPWEQWDSIITDAMPPIDLDG